MSKKKYEEIKRKVENYFLIAKGMDLSLTVDTTYADSGLLMLLCSQGIIYIDYLFPLDFDRLRISQTLNGDSPKLKTLKPYIDINLKYLYLGRSSVKDIGPIFDMDTVTTVCLPDSGIPYSSVISLCCNNRNLISVFCEYGEFMRKGDSDNWIVWTGDFGCPYHSLSTNF